MLGIGISNAPASKGRTLVDAESGDMILYDSFNRIGDLQGSFPDYNLYKKYWMQEAIIGNFNILDNRLRHSPQTGSILSTCFVDVGNFQNRARVTVIPDDIQPNIAASVAIRRPCFPNSVLVIEGYSFVISGSYYSGNYTCQLYLGGNSVASVLTDIPVDNSSLIIEIEDNGTSVTGRIVGTSWSLTESTSAPSYARKNTSVGLGTYNFFSSGVLYYDDFTVYKA